MKFPLREAGKAKRNGQMEIAILGWGSLLWDRKTQKGKELAQFTNRMRS